MENTFDYLKRRAYDELLAWKNDLSDKAALLIEGARRVGKTSLIRRFVEKEYESFIYIDFSEKGRAVRAYKTLLHNVRMWPICFSGFRFFPELR